MVDIRLTEFLHYLRFEKRYAPLTLLAYQNDLKQFRDYIFTQYEITDIAAVTHFHIRGWLAGMKDEGLAARSLNRKMSSLSAFYLFLRKNGFADKNPVRQLHAQRLPERLPVFLKETETDRLLDVVEFAPGFKGMTDRLICELLYATGMRRNELQQLKETDIEWGLKQLRILGKGNKERLVPVSEALLDQLRMYIAEKQLLPASNTAHLLNLANGEPLYAQYIYRIARQYLGLVTTAQKKSPHVLRHTFATHLLNNGANIQAIRDLLGHSSLAATQVYTHNNIDKLKEIHHKTHPRG